MICQEPPCIFLISCPSSTVIDLFWIIEIISHLIVKKVFPLKGISYNRYCSKVLVKLIIIAPPPPPPPCPGDGRFYSINNICWCCWLDLNSGFTVFSCTNNKGRLCNCQRHKQFLRIGKKRSVFKRSPCSVKICETQQLQNILSNNIFLLFRPSIQSRAPLLPRRTQWVYGNQELSQCGKT